MIGSAVPQAREEQEWTEGVAIWCAVLLVSLVGALLLHIPRTGINGGLSHRACFKRDGPSRMGTWPASDGHCFCLRGFERFSRIIEPLEQSNAPVMSAQHSELSRGQVWFDFTTKVLELISWCVRNYRGWQ